MLLFGLALVLMMLFRPAGILPSALRKRELEAPNRRMTRRSRTAQPASRCSSPTGISKRFGGVQALADVELHDPPRRDLRPDRPERRRQDQSLFNVLTGIYAPDAGEFVFDGAAARPVSSRNEVAERGIARTFQNIRLFANLSALENVMIGRHVRTHANVFGAIFRDASDARRGEGDREARPRAARVRRHRRSARTRSRSISPTATSAGSRSRARSPPIRKLLALDEPAAGMNATETAALKRPARRASGATARRSC